MRYLTDRSLAIVMVRMSRLRADDLGAIYRYCEQKSGAVFYDPSLSPIEACKLLFERMDIFSRFNLSTFDLVNMVHEYGKWLC